MIQKIIQAILNNTNQLKDVNNTKGRLYYCNVQLPEELHENRCSYQKMIQDNRDRDPANQLPLKLQGAKLLINGQPY